MNIPHNIAYLCLLAASLTACNPATESDETKASADNETSTTITASSNTQETDDFPYRFEQVTNHTWVMHGPLELPNPENQGFMNNPGIVKTSAGLVIIDPGSTVHVGNSVLNRIRQISDLPIVATFNTHVHGDHWLANQAIKAAYPEVKIYGHPQMLLAIENGAGKSWVDLMHTMTEGASDGTVVVAPEQPIDHGDIIIIGDTRFKIHHYGAAHSKTDIMIEVVEESVVFLGDNVLAKRIARMADGDFQGNITSIDKILKTDVQSFVPGHGPSGDRAMVEEFRNYLSLIYEAAQQTFADDLDSSDVITISRETTAAYKNWSGFEEQLGAHGAQAYSEVEAAEF